MVAWRPWRRLAAKDVLEYGAEIVVAATGSSWATDGMSGITNEPIPGADASLPHVATPEQVMLGDKEIGQRVLVYDCEMYYTGIGMAEKLVREGKDVTYVTPFEAMAPYTVYTLEFPRLNRHLRQLGIDVVVEHVVTAIEPGKAQLAEVWTEEERAVDVDTVVLVTQRVSDDALYRELSGDPGCSRRCGHRRPLPDRRLRPAVADRRGRVQRSPARARDRLAEPEGAAALHPGAAASGRDEEDYQLRSPAIAALAR